MIRRNRDMERRLTASGPCPCDECKLREYCRQEVACGAFLRYVKHGPARYNARNWAGDKPSSFKFRLAVAQS